MTVEQSEEEMRRVIAFTEAVTGLRSRWNGTIWIVDAATAALTFPVPFLAKKDWDCGITLLEETTRSAGRWRSLLHEALHSVSVGLTKDSYDKFAPWEEAVAETLQRLYRPALLRYLELDIPEATFQTAEKSWRYSREMDALSRIAAERPEIAAQGFFERLLQTPLADRPTFAFEWGREAADFSRFKRVYAAASGALR